MVCEVQYIRYLALIIISFLVFISCSDSEEQTNSQKLRYKKETKVIQPKSRHKLKLGEPIFFEVSGADVLIDSVKLEMAEQTKTYMQSSFSIANPSQKVGTIRAKLSVYFNGEKEIHIIKVVFLPPQPPETYSYRVINTYHHNPDDYTQGLLIDDGFLYESSGQYGNSTLKKKELVTGETLQQVNLSDDYFGEGLALLDDKFYQLTYKSGTCLVYDENFSMQDSYGYDGEGWGLCAYRGQLLMTNGSEKITVRDPQSFAIIEEIQVYDDLGKVKNLNELEVIDGLIYANVWLTDLIVVIDPFSGAVLRKIDASGLLNENPTSISPRNNVLNGIAYDEVGKKIFLTGKYWSKLFEVEFFPINSSS